MKTNLCSGLLVIVVAAVVLLNTPALADRNVIDYSQVDFTRLMSDIQRMDITADRTLIIMWFPTEYWEIFAAQDPSVASADLAEVINMLDKYTMIVVSDTSNSAWSSSYADACEIRDSLMIEDRNGNYLKPVPESDIDSSTLTFLEMVRPVWENSLGELGESIQVVLFPGYDNDGYKLCSAVESGKFKVHYKDGEYKFRAPLSSLLPGKYCAACDEDLSGAYEFCPYCGKRV